jgi:hypothetical protein
MIKWWLHDVIFLISTNNLKIIQKNGLENIKKNIKNNNKQVSKKKIRGGGKK